MNFKVVNVESYSARANKVQMAFVNTNTNLDGCTVSVFAPKSVEFKVGEINDVPQFVANGAFNSYAIKGLEKQMQMKAPRGQKMIWKSQTAELVAEVSKMNTETKYETKGEYVGTKGEYMATNLKYDRCVYAQDQVGFGWRHTGHGWAHPTWVKKIYRFLDEKGNVFMFETTGAKTQEKIEELNEFEASFKVVAHEEYRGVRQTWISEVKVQK